MFFRYKKIYCMPDYDGGTGAGDSGIGGIGGGDTDSGGDGGLGAIDHGGYGIGGVDDSASNPNNPDFSGDGASDYSTPTEDISIDLGSPSIESSTFNEKGISAFDAMDGISVSNGFLDTHYTLNGMQFSFTQELAADALETLGISINTRNIDLAQDIAKLGIGIAIGMPAISIGLKALSISSNIANINDVLSDSTNTSIQTAIALTNLSISTYNSLQNISLGIEAIDAGYTTLGVAIATSSALGIYSNIDSINALLGINGMDPTLGYKSTIGSGSGKTKLITTIAQNSQTITKSKKSISYYLNSFLTGKIYEYLAGGDGYNAYLAGGSLFNPLGIENPPNKGLGIASIQANTFMVKNNNYPYANLAGDMDYAYAGSENFSPMEFLKAIQI